MIGTKIVNICYAAAMILSIFVEALIQLLAIPLALVVLLVSGFGKVYELIFKYAQEDPSQE